MDYPKEQLWELYKSIPEDLQKAVFSADVSDKIFDICGRNKITEEEKISQIAKYIGYVLLGLLPPNEFQETLEKEIKIAKADAKKISREVNGFIFVPVRNSLEALYSIKIGGAGGKTEIPEKKPKEEQRTASSKTDTYREIIE